MYCMVLSNRYIFASSSNSYNIISKQNYKMKTLKNLTSLMLMLSFFTCGIAAVAIPENGNGGQVVKAVLYQGELIPVVDLPEVEISASRSSSTLLPAYYINGTMVAMANLPVVEITAERMTSSKMRAVQINGETLAVVNLPLIEIVSDLPANGLIALNVRNETKDFIPTVNLPMVEIRASAGKEAFAKTVYTEAGIVPVIYLPEVEIVSTRAAIVISRPEANMSSFQSANMYFVSLESAEDLSDPTLMKIIQKIQIPLSNTVYEGILDAFSGN
jgi:hypothetical protein